MADNELGFDGCRLEEADDDDELPAPLAPIEVSATTFDGPEPTFSGSQGSEFLDDGSATRFPTFLRDRLTYDLVEASETLGISISDAIRVWCPKITRSHNTQTPGDERTGTRARF